MEDRMLAFRFLATVTAQSLGRDVDFMPQREPVYLTDDELMFQLRAMSGAKRASD